MTIEGIPDGWELVRIGSPIVGVDWVVNRDGTAVLCEVEHYAKNWPIIRKIEKPKQYRPFQNAAESHRLWDAVLKLANPANGSEDSRYRINSITRDGATIGLQFLDYRKAFEMFVCDDGTPFGIEVTE